MQSGHQWVGAADGEPAIGGRSIGVWRGRGNGLPAMASLPRSGISFASSPPAGGDPGGVPCPNFVLLYSPSPCYSPHATRSPSPATPVVPPQITRNPTPLVWPG